MWEAIAAGSVPVLVDVPSLHGCARPGMHMRHLSRGWALWLNDWADLPALLEREVMRTVAYYTIGPSQALCYGSAWSLLAQVPNATALFARQQRMKAWLQDFTSSTWLRLQQTAAAMREGRWQPPASCLVHPLLPQQLVRTHKELASYWRQPQPFVQSKGLFHPATSRSFLGDNGDQRTLSFCDSRSDASSLNGDNFQENCLTHHCSPPLVGGLTCVPAYTARNHRR